MAKYRVGEGRLTRSLVLLAAWAACVAVLLEGCGGKGVDDDYGLASYQADFSSSEELKNWKCNDKGKWEIRDGSLVGDVRAPDERSILWLDRALANNIEVQFEAECLDKPGDVNCFVSGNGNEYSGYEVIVGGWRNTKVAIYRGMEDGDPMSRDRVEREPFEMEKGRVYAIKIKKDDGKFRLYVDDELLITAIDAQPIDDREHRYFGFSTFENVVRFDNLTIKKKE